VPVTVVLVNIELTPAVEEMQEASITIEFYSINITLVTSER
jgi:hypothetical protein